jgi:hypothetical protein
MPTEHQESRIESLLDAIAADQQEIYELGTPQPFETQAVRELIAMGPQIVPYLQQRAERSPAKLTASIVLALGELGDRNLVEWLRQLRTKYENLEKKTAWDYSVIGQSNAAIERLDKGA